VRHLFPLLAQSGGVYYRLLRNGAGRTQEDPMRLSIAAVVALSLPVSLALAQERPAGEKPAAEASMEMPKPGPEHGHLKSSEGVWDTTIEAQGQPTSKGTSTMKMSLNGFWLLEEFTCDWAGMKFQGRGTTGYDPNKKKFVATWVDNASPALMVTEGTFDPKTKTATMIGDGYNEKNEKVKVRTLAVHKDANTVVFEMYQTPASGKEAKVMTITYKRKA
jgi:hypothetical protein